MNHYNFSFDLCPDAMVEILSRVPLKTLAKCRLLSREYNKLSYDFSFLSLHCKRTKTVAGFIIQTLFHSHSYSTFVSIDSPDFSTNLTLDFLPNLKTKILAADKGLVYCAGQFSNDCYICKPSTRQWERIPNPNPGFFTVKTGIMVLGSNPTRFKIVRLSQPGPEEEDAEDFDIYQYKLLHCEVFDPETWAWNQVNDLILPSEEYFNNKHAVRARGGLHWLTSNQNQNNILSFYPGRWELVKLPDEVISGFNVNLAEYEGKPALICLKHDVDVVEIWVLNGRVWSRKQSVDMSGVSEEIGHSSTEAFYNADTVLVKGMFSAVFHNFRTGQSERLELPSKFRYADSAFFLHSDDKPIQFRQPRKSEESLRPLGLLRLTTTSLFLIRIFLSFLVFIFFSLRLGSSNLAS